MSKLQALLFERVNKREVIDFVEGVNGLIAVTANTVYLVRGSILEKKVVKTYAIKSISSIEIRKPNLITNGHFQIIASGSGDRTKRYSTAFDYAKDENTVMIRSNYEHFLRIEQLIYKQRDKADHVTEIIAPVAVAKEDDDVFSKIEKLASLKERNLISAEEYEKKKAELLSQI
jgi:hypothetical protein